MNATGGTGAEVVVLAGFLLVLTPQTFLRYRLDYAIYM